MPFSSDVATLFTGCLVLENEAKVLEDYLVGQRLGEGAYGSVYVAKYIPSGEAFALKILQKQDLYQPYLSGDGTAAPVVVVAPMMSPAVDHPLGNGGGDEVLTTATATTPITAQQQKKAAGPANHFDRLIVQEAMVMQSLEHPHVVKLYKFLSSTVAFYFIMELAEGGELFDLVISKGYFGEDEARHFFQQLVSAIDYCHSNGVAHKDLKAENLLLSKDNRLLVCDFGFSSKAVIRNVDDPGDDEGNNTGGGDGPGSGLNAASNGGGDYPAAATATNGQASPLFSETTTTTINRVVTGKKSGDSASFGPAVFGTLHYMSPEAVAASRINCLLGDGSWALGPASPVLGNSNSITSSTGGGGGDPRHMDGYGEGSYNTSASASSSGSGSSSAYSSGGSGRGRRDGIASDNENSKGNNGGGPLPRSRRRAAAAASSSSSCSSSVSRATSVSSYVSAGGGHHRHHHHNHNRHRHHHHHHRRRRYPHGAAQPPLISPYAQLRAAAMAAAAAEANAGLGFHSSSTTQRAQTSALCGSVAEAGGEGSITSPAMSTRPSVAEFDSLPLPLGRAHGGRPAAINTATTSASDRDAVLVASSSDRGSAVSPGGASGPGTAAVAASTNSFRVGLGNPKGSVSTGALDGMARREKQPAAAAGNGHHHHAKRRHRSQEGHRSLRSEEFPSGGSTRVKGSGGVSGQIGAWVKSIMGDKEDRTAMRHSRSATSLADGPVSSPLEAHAATTLLTGGDDVRRGKREDKKEAARRQRAEQQQALLVARQAKDCKREPPGGLSDANSKKSKNNVNGKVKDRRRMAAAATTPTTTAPAPQPASTRRSILVDPYQQDLWSAGVILFFMLTGRLPFDGATDEDTQHQILHNAYEWGEEEIARTSPEVRQLVKAMLSPDPTDRPALNDIITTGWFVRRINISGGFPHRAEELRHRLLTSGLLAAARGLCSGSGGSPASPDTNYGSRVASSSFHSGVREPGSPTTTAGGDDEAAAALSGSEASAFLDFAAPSHIVTEDEEQALATAFNKIDTDGYGKITRDELRDMMTTLHGDMVASGAVSELVQLFTGDLASAEITFSQFRDAWVNRNLAHLPFTHSSEFQLAKIIGVQMDEVEREIVRQLRAAFDAVDVHHSGVIELEELRRVFESCGLPVARPELISLMQFFDDRDLLLRNNSSLTEAAARGGANAPLAAAAVLTNASFGAGSSTTSLATTHNKSPKLLPLGVAVPPSATLAATTTRPVSPGACAEGVTPPCSPLRHLPPPHRLCISFDAFLMGIVRRDILLRHPLGRKLAAATNLTALFHSRNVTECVRHGFLVSGLQNVVLEKIASVPERLLLLYSDEVVSNTENIYSFRYLGSSALVGGATMGSAVPLLAASLAAAGGGGAGVLSMMMSPTNTNSNSTGGGSPNNNSCGGGSTSHAGSLGRNAAPSLGDFPLSQRGPLSSRPSKGQLEQITLHHIAVVAPSAGSGNGTGNGSSSADGIAAAATAVWGSGSSLAMSSSHHGGIPLSPRHHHHHNHHPHHHHALPPHLLHSHDGHSPTTPLLASSLPLASSVPVMHHPDSPLLSGSRRVGGGCRRSGGQRSHSVRSHCGPSTGNTAVGSSSVGSADGDSQFSSDRSRGSVLDSIEEEELMRGISGGSSCRGASRGRPHTLPAEPPAAAAQHSRSSSCSSASSHTASPNDIGGQRQQFPNAAAAAAAPHAAADSVNSSVLHGSSTGGSGSGGTSAASRSPVAAGSNLTLGNSNLTTAGGGGCDGIGTRSGGSVSAPPQARVRRPTTAPVARPRPLSPNSVHLLTGGGGTAHYPLSLDAHNSSSPHSCLLTRHGSAPSSGAFLPAGSPPSSSSAAAAAVAAATASAASLGATLSAQTNNPMAATITHRMLSYGNNGAVLQVNGVCDVDVILAPACLGYTLLRFRRIHGKTRDFHEAVSYISNLLDFERQQAVEDTMPRGESELM